MSAAVTAHVLPTFRSLSQVGVVMDRLRRGEEISYFSSTLELLVLFGSIFWETFFLAEVSILLYVFPFSVPFQLIVRCIVLLLHHSP
jgi:hypothetical protein